MATFTFQPNSGSRVYNWGNPATWAGGVVPDDVTADVVIPEVINNVTNTPFVSQIFVDPNQSFTVNSLSISDNIVPMSGSLTVRGQLTLDAGAIVAIAGALSVGSFQNAGELYSSGGTITSSQASSNTGLIKSDLNTLLLALPNFTNSGDIYGYKAIIDASRGFTNTGVIDIGPVVNVGSGSFTNSGTIRGGTVHAANGGLRITRAAL